jgi:hypothetical protein
MIGINMIKKHSALFILVFLFINLFFESFFSHNNHSETKNDLNQRVTYEEAHSTAHQSQVADDHCANGVCHSGFCQLLKVNNTLDVSRYDLNNLYYVQTYLVPDYPYLYTTRKPPKFIA